MLPSKKRVGRPRKTTNGAVNIKKETTDINILNDVEIVLNGLLNQVAKKVLNTDEASAMLRILIHLKVQAQVKPAAFKAESLTRPFLSNILL